MARRAGKYPSETSKTPQPPILAHMWRVWGASDGFGGLTGGFARHGGVQKGAVGQFQPRLETAEGDTVGRVVAALVALERA